MDIKFIQTGNPKSGGDPRPSIDVPVGRYAMLALVLTGTADTGQALAKGSIARFRLDYDGKPLQAQDFEFYSDIDNLYFGFATFDNPDAGAQRAVCFIPLFLPGFANTLDVFSKELADLEIEFDSALDTVFGSNSASWELYGLQFKDIPQRYNLRVVEQNFQASAAGRLSDSINAKNIGTLFVRDASDVANRVQVDVDGRTVIDNIDDDFLRDVTSLMNRIESSGFGLAQINIANTETGSEETTLNDNTEVELNFTGSGTVEVTAMALNWMSQQERNNSRQRAQNYLATRNSDRSVNQK